jgi:sec-independent protein translocase protein TatC
VSQPADPFESTRMTLGEHLDELRKRLIRGLIAIAVAFFLGWWKHEELGRILLQPLHRVLAMLNDARVEEFEKRLREDPSLPRTAFFLSEDESRSELLPKYAPSSQVMTTGVPEYFLFALKVSLYFALVAGSPVLLWQLWKFVAAGLYPREQRIFLRTFPVMLALFLAGIVFGFTLLVPYGLYFLALATPPEDVVLMPRLSEYLTLLTSLTLALGFVFQLPVVVYALVRVDLVRRETFVKYRSHFIVAAFVVAAVLTPPDPYTQLLLAIPMCILFEVGLLAARRAGKPAAVEAQA